jgi:hypothetical protein
MIGAPPGEIASPDSTVGRPDSWLVDAAVFAATSATLTITADLGELDVPKSFRQAMRSPQRDYWREAIAKELAGLLALETWEMVPASSMPPGANLMHCHYVFAVKRKADGSIEKFKARLVADGNTQKHGVDFDRVFATVVKTSTIRLVLLLAAARDYNLSSIDIRQAYLQSLLDPNVPLYMRPPPDVFPFDQHGNPLVCKLLLDLLPRITACVGKFPLRISRGKMDSDVAEQGFSPAQIGESTVRVRKGVWRHRRVKRLRTDARRGRDAEDDCHGAYHNCTCYSYRP